MNLLLDPFPKELNIAGEMVPVATDWRYALAVIMAFEDSDLTQVEKQNALINNLFYETPKDWNAAMAQAVWYLNAGRDDKESGPHRLVSFHKDAAFIFAAFRQTHGIDLETAKMHWWKFMALFMDLGQESTFCQIVALRKRLKTGKATKDERIAARDMGSMIDVPDDEHLTLDERDAIDAFWSRVEESEKKRNAKTDTPPTPA